MKRKLILIGIAIALASSSITAFAAPSTPNCSSAVKGNWAQCVFDDAATRGS